jgi:hypothetical protein
VNNILHQFKGASKMVLILNIMLGLLNFTILKDNRHVSFLVLGENCQAVAAATDQLAAFNKFGGGQ